MDQQHVKSGAGSGLGPFLERVFHPERRSRPALATRDAVIPYHELTRSVQHAAQRLQAMGVRPGDPVMLALPNSPAQLVTTLALMSLGTTIVPVGANESPARFERLLVECAPAFCLADPESGLSIHGLDTIGELDLPEPVLLFSPAPARGSGETTRAGSTGAEPPAFIRFSSGSTGRPKGIVLSRRQVVWMARNLSEIYGLDGDHRELLISSMALSDGWQRVAATLFAGGCLSITEETPTVSGILDAIAEYRITGFFTPPPLVRMMLAGDEEPMRDGLAGCRSLEIGSAPLTASELERFMTLVPEARVFVHYGLTECSRAVILDTRRFPAKLGTVGNAAPGVKVKIVSGGREECPPGKAGEIYLQGPQLADGYWGRPELNAERFVDGWLATGDIGRLDEDGFLSFLGRSDDRLNVGGFSFFPAEVESVLGPVQGVAQYLIAGVPDRRGILGEVPWAFVVPSGDGEWSPKEFLARARERLPAYMRPRWVVRIPELPLTPSDKPDRRRTVALYAPQAKGKSNG